MIQKQLDRIEKADLESLVANEAAESRTIEYKLELPGNKDSDKKEFLADVSSFANAAGGDLLFGVDEKRGADGKATGIPESVPGLAIANAETELRRLESIIRDGIKPRIAGVHLQPIDGFPNGPAFLIRVQKSYAAPHMVTFQEHSRFYSRDGRGKYPMDVVQIRSAFALSESLPERIRRFRDERLARIVAGETPSPVKDGPKVVLHLLPISSLDATTQVDLEKGSQSLRPMNCSAWDFRYNIDGFLSHNTRNDADLCRSYTQLFRSGAIEALDSRILDNNGGRKVLPPYVGGELLHSLKGYLALYNSLGVEPPVVLMVSLLGVKGYVITDSFQHAEGFIDRDTILLPDLLVDDFLVDLPSLLRPAFDALWQASGWSRCFYYDKAGNLIER